MPHLVALSTHETIACRTLTLPIEDRPWAGDFKQRSTTGFLDMVMGAPLKYEALSRDGVAYSGAPYGIGPAPTSLLAQTIHDCFAEHIGLSLSPEVLWYAVLSQFATDVKRNPAAYRDLFTTSPEAETIIVIHDGLRMGIPLGWDEAISTFGPKLMARVPSGVMGNCLPTFTTSSPESNIATLVTFMDAASPFYKYEVHTRCGIPSIRLEGTPADWTTFRDSVQKLSRFARTPLMVTYFRHLLPVAEKIAATALGNEMDVTFWKSTYKANDESGGITVNGWITAFWAYLSDKSGGVRPKDDKDFAWESLRGFFGSLHPDSFTSHVSEVPFVWEYFGNRIDMRFIAGVLGVEVIDRHLAPRLGWAVAYK